MASGDVDLLNYGVQVPAIRQAADRGQVELHFCQ
jgi:hypothetical protein